MNDKKKPATVDDVPPTEPAELVPAPAKPVESPKQNDLPDLPPR